MHIEPVTFTRVFDVTRDPSRRTPVRTTFGFESQGKKIFGAVVNGLPHIPEGEPLLVVMKRKDDWKTILGWAKVATGQLDIQDGRKDVIFYGLAFLVGLVIMAPLFVMLWLDAHGLFAFFIGLMLLQFGVVHPVSALLYRWDLCLARQALMAAMTHPSPLTSRLHQLDS